MDDRRSTLSARAAHRPQATVTFTGAGHIGRPSLWGKWRPSDSAPSSHLPMGTICSSALTPSGAGWANGANASLAKMPQADDLLSTLFLLSAALSLFRIHSPCFLLHDHPILSSVGLLDDIGWEVSSPNSVSS